MTDQPELNYGVTHSHMGQLLKKSTAARALEIALASVKQGNPDALIPNHGEVIVEIDPSLFVGVTLRFVPVTRES